MVSSDLANPISRFQHRPNARKRKPGTTIPVNWAFWFMMQIAMMLGLATTFPMNWWLIRRGVKEAM